MKARRSANSDGIIVTQRHGKSKRSQYTLVLLSILALVICGAIGIYAFLAGEVTKVDVSGPDSVGPVVVPEDYKNLLVLDVTIPPFDAGRIQEDIKLHNGVAASYSRDVLLPFAPTDWYSDHDGDSSFDGNIVSGQAEAIVSSNDNILDANDVVKKTGLCLIESFDYSSGMGEQYIDSDHSLDYNNGEAIVRISTSSGQVHPGEVIRSGSADITSFPSNIRFTDGINGGVSPAHYDNGEAIISSGDGILDSGDTVLTPGNADLRSLPGNVLYPDFNDDSRYGTEEAIVEDNGVQGELEAGLLNGSGIDKVIRTGKADLKPMSGGNLKFADDNDDNVYNFGELIVDSGDLNVDAGEVKLSGSANLHSMAGLSFADDNDNGQFNSSELVIRNTGVHNDVLEAADTIVLSGNADLQPFAENVEEFIDDNGNGLYDDGECIIREGDGDNGTLSGSDVVVKPGPAFLTVFGSDIKWIDANENSQYDDEELIINSPNDILSSGEVVKPGYCGLKSLDDTYEGQVYSDNDNNDTYSSNELIIQSTDTILDSGDTVVTAGAACMLRLKDTFSRFIDADGGLDFDPDEAIVYDSAGERVLDDGDTVSRSGSTDIEDFGDETVYIDNNGDGNFKGDSDNDVTWDDSDDSTWANDPDVVADQDEAVLNDPAGAKHLALDSADTVLRPGLALLTAFPATDVYTDDGDGQYDGDASNEAIIRDNNANLLLEDSDAVLVTGTALIRDFSNAASTTAERFIDNNHDGTYTAGEAIWRDSNGNDLLDPGEIVRAGYAALLPVGDGTKFTDDERANGSFDSDEAIVNDANANNMIDPGEVIAAGKADTVGEDRNRNGVIDPGEADLDDDNSDIPYAAYPSLPDTAADHKAYMYACETMSGTRPLRYIDANSNSDFSSNEAIIRDSGGAVGVPNSLLDAGNLNGAGTDDLLMTGSANLIHFNRPEKFVDGNRNGTFDAGEAVVYDWYKQDSPNQFEGEFILAGDPVPGAPLSPSGILTYQAPGSRTHDCVLLAGEPNYSAMAELNNTGAHKYVDNNHSNSYDGFYAESGYEAIIWSANYQLDEGELEGTGADHVLSAGYASMRLWPDDLAWTDSDHDGKYQGNEAIVSDAGLDSRITSIGSTPSEDRIIVAGEADLNIFEKMKYVDANDNDVFDDGELKINDANQDNKVDNSEIEAAGPVIYSQSFAGTDYRFCDSDHGGDFDAQEAVVKDLSTSGILEPSDEVVTAGTISPQNFNALADRYADSDHNNQYDYSIAAGFGEAIVINTSGDINSVESSDTIETEGYADLLIFDGTDYKYSDSNGDADFTAGELVINDLSGDDEVDEGEIIISGLANLKSFSATVMYIDADSDSLYSNSEAIISTADANLGSDDEVLATGASGLHSFEVNTYRFADADHDSGYDTGEAIIVEDAWGTVDDVLEDSDIVILSGNADIEQFTSSFGFLDDAANSNTYENGEAIVDDSSGDNRLDPGEIVTGGRAALTKFAGGKKYTDGGTGANARNSQYDQDEAIILDGNSNNSLDAGLLNGAGNDKVITSGKAGLTQFENDGLPESPNCDDEHYVDTDGNSQYDGNEDIYQDRDNNNMVTTGDDALKYFVVENTGTADNSDLAAVKLWADRDDDGQFEPDTNDSPALASLISDATNAKMWYEGPASAPPLSSASARTLIDYAIPTGGQRFFVTVDIGVSPADGREIQISIPINGVNTVFGSPGPSDGVVTNAYAQKIDFATPVSVNMTSPDAGESLYGQVVLEANASDTVQIGKVVFYDGIPGAGGVPIAEDDDGAPWEALWDCSEAGFGSHTLYARAYDRTYLRPPQTWGIDHHLDSQGVNITVAASYDLELASGWNFVSVPVEAFDPSINSLFSSIGGNPTSVWAYNAVTSGWARYDLNSPGFLNDLSTIDMSSGYWILMSAAGTVSISGAISDTSISLQSGWNLVGCNSLTPVNVVDATSSITCDFSVWTTDPNTGEWLSYNPDDSFNDLDTIEPGRAYWINVAESCVWHIEPEE